MVTAEYVKIITLYKLYYIVYIVVLKCINEIHINIYIRDKLLLFIKRKRKKQYLYISRISRAERELDRCDEKKLKSKHTG